MLTSETAKLWFPRDGKTASIARLDMPDRVVQIRTNGKADASINLSGSGRYQMDAMTMVLSDAPPLLLKPDARSVAKLGMGSGLTSPVVLTNPGGVMPQWLPRHGIDESLVMSVVKSFDENFDDYAIYAANAVDAG